jgi:atypical dual specificity phosphatase
MQDMQLRDATAMVCMTIFYSNAVSSFSTYCCVIGIHFHVTVAASYECNGRDAEIAELLKAQSSSTFQILPVAIGSVKNSSSEAFYCIVYCGNAMAIRRSLGLDLKHLHITLGFVGSDVHDRKKSLENVTKTLPLQSLILLSDGITKHQNARTMDDIALSVIRYLVRQLMDCDCIQASGESEVMTQLKHICKCIMNRIEAADIVFSVARYLLDRGYLLGLRAMIESSIVCQRKLDFSDILPFQLPAEGMIKGEQQLLRSLISINKRLEGRFIAQSISVEKPTNLLGTYFLPRNFSFVNHGRCQRLLAGSAIPTKLAQICALYGIGVKVIITLHEEPLCSLLSEPALRMYGINTHHYNVVDRTPLTLKQLEEVCCLIASYHKKNEVVHIHCQGGVGRTIMAIIAYLMSQHSISASEAKLIVESQRKVLMDDSQLEALKKWWIKCSSVSSIDDGTRMTTRSMPPLIILVGYAASGKSTFATGLVETYPNQFQRINRDEMRGKGEIDAKFSDVLKKNSRGATVTAVVDMCNLTLEARKVWLDAGYRGRAWCIFFDIPIEECRYRIQRRQGHPTIPPGSFGLTILASMEKQLRSPTLKEGFERLIVVSKESEFSQLLSDFNLPQNIIPKPNTEESSHLIKFPRTPHALDLGGATRDDKVCSAGDLELLFGSQIYVEEKMDGANMGISISAEGKLIVQNRSHFITSSYHAQFAPLDKWIARHSSELWDILEPGRHVLYGEWLYATHSVAYSELPDWFVVYDLFDKMENKFISRPVLEDIFKSTSICISPLIYSGEIKSRKILESLVNGPSAFGADKREGIVIRACEGRWLISRSKIVRSDFIPGNDRWNKSSTLMTNSILLSVPLQYEEIKTED